VAFAVRTQDGLRTPVETRGLEASCPTENIGSFRFKAADVVVVSHPGVFNPTPRTSRVVVLQLDENVFVFLNADDHQLRHIKLSLQ
jgi:hypothetical protein